MVLILCVRKQKHEALSFRGLTHSPQVLCMGHSVPHWI